MYTRKLATPTYDAKINSWGGIRWQHKDKDEDSVYDRDFLNVEQLEGYLIDRYGKRFASKVIKEYKDTGTATNRK